LQRARAAGIKVITHESPKQKNADWDFELASVKGFGEAYAKNLAAALGGKGEYAVFVGSLTVPLHNAWADAAIAYLKANDPGMTLVGDRYGVAEDVDASRKTALDLMRAHPNLKAILAFGSQGPIGKARTGQCTCARPVLARAGQASRARWRLDRGLYVESRSRR
jgi:simple sugar transport system substrate-binding protein